MSSSSSSHQQRHIIQQNHLQAWAKSGLSQLAYSKLHGIKYQTFVSVQPYHIVSITHFCKTTPFQSKGVFLWLLPTPVVIYLPNNTTTM